MEVIDRSDPYSELRSAYPRLIYMFGPGLYVSDRADAILAALHRGGSLVLNLRTEMSLQTLRAFLENVGRHIKDAETLVILGQSAELGDRLGVGRDEDLSIWVSATDNVITRAAAPSTVEPPGAWEHPVAQMVLTDLATRSEVRIPQAMSVLYCLPEEVIIVMWASDAIDRCRLHHIRGMEVAGASCHGTCPGTIVRVGYEPRVAYCVSMEDQRAEKVIALGRCWDFHLPSEVTEPDATREAAISFLRQQASITARAAAELVAAALTPFSVLSERLPRLWRPEDISRNTASEPAS